MSDPNPSDEWIEAANCLATVASTLASAMHDANNMLQVIAGSAEMIHVNPQATDTIAKRAATISEHAHRLSGMLGAIRELSKCPPRVAGEGTDVSAIVATALELRRHALHRARVAVAFTSPDGPQVAASSWRPVVQVVLNLLMNAERAVAGRDGARIAIDARRDGNDVALSISDNGAGMAAPAPFRLQELDDAAPLLGLGLRAVQIVVARENGRLDVRSGVDGTTVVVRLPAV